MQDIEKLQFNEEKFRTSEKKLKMQMKNLIDDNQKLNSQLEVSDEKCDKFMKEIKFFKSEQKKNLDELTKIKLEVNLDD